jgi:hypothetical protein
VSDLVTLVRQAATISWLNQECDPVDRQVEQLLAAMEQVSAEECRVLGEHFIELLRRRAELARKVLPTADARERVRPAVALLPPPSASRSATALIAAEGQVESHTETSKPLSGLGEKASRQTHAHDPWEGLLTLTAPQSDLSAQVERGVGSALARLQFIHAAYVAARASS